MMLFIITVILILYARTYNYNLLIDDPVPRDGYLYQTSQRVNYSFYDKKRPVLATITNIVTFIAVCGYINLIWGWQAALLYAVCPLNVCGAAWVTGNYYTTTALLVLAAHFFLGLQTSWSIFLAVLFYTAALNSTVNALAYMFIAPIYGLSGFVMIIPAIMFLTGKRMSVGLKLRAERQKHAGYESKFQLENIKRVPRIIAYYIALSLMPLKLGMFHSWGRNIDFYKISTKILSVILCLLFGMWAYTIDPLMAAWWFISIGIFTHIQGTYGQYIAERYTLLSNVALSVLLSKFLISYPNALWVIATLWFCQSLAYIPAWKHNVYLFSHGITSFPTAPENYVNLSSYYLERNRYDEALKPLLLAEKFTNGNKTNIYVNLSSCFMFMKHYDKALFYVNKAMETCSKQQYVELNDSARELRSKILRSGRLHKKLMEI